MRPVRVSQSQKIKEKSPIATLHMIITAMGRLVIKLDITGLVTQRTIEIRFSDDCGGVASEHETRLFEPFFTTKPHGSGTGLGLCVAERIVGEMGGRITFHNHPGHGIEFVVEFPVIKRS